MIPKHTSREVEKWNRKEIKPVKCMLMKPVITVSNLQKPSRTICYQLTTEIKRWYKTSIDCHEIHIDFLWYFIKILAKRQTKTGTSQILREFIANLNEPNIQSKLKCETIVRKSRVRIENPFNFKVRHVLSLAQGAWHYHSSTLLDVAVNFKINPSNISIHVRFQLWE